MSNESQDKPARKTRLVAMLGKPPSVEAARAAIAKLPADAAIVTNDDACFAAAALDGRLRTRDTVRTADAIAADADEVVDFRAAQGNAPAQQAAEADHDESVDATQPEAKGKR